MEHEHGQDGEFIEVKVGYVEAFNRSLDDMTQIQRSAIMLAARGLLICQKNME